MTTILIVEQVADPRQCVVHQAHKSFENAIETIKTTHCKIRDVSIRVSELTMVKGQATKFVRVRYEHEGQLIQSDFALIELVVLDHPDHL